MLVLQQLSCRITSSRTMHDIIPRKSPKQTLEESIDVPESRQMSTSNLDDQISNSPVPIPPPTKSKKIFKKKRHSIAAIATFVIVISIVVSVLWYNTQLGAKGKDLSLLVPVKIDAGTTPTQIGQLLQDKHVIKNALSFDIYTRLSATQNKLQAGTYRLSPAETVKQIVEHLVNGTVDQFSITFLPGATVKDDREVLIKAGFSTSIIDSALAKTYNSPLFASKPADTDLEGYIYGETYNFNSGATVEDILNRSFGQFLGVVQDNKLVDRFAKQGLNLYQGITLASIIQREVHSPSDQNQVAQVFYKRLAQGIPLGSDVTFIYAAAKQGVPAISTLNSPYNTRINTGLPPGPIAVPGLSALQAVASPASGNYLFFLSGDDGTTYFSMTDAEHVANIQAHCQVKCAAP
jgi:UPF0755 protein